VAAEAADYLYRMAGGNLRRFATISIWRVGRREHYITQQSVWAALKLLDLIK
jgi:hypothetical protein